MSLQTPVPNKAQYYKKVDTSRKIDLSFARTDDIPLTEEEKAQIDAFWGKYNFAYPNIDYKSFQTFKNRCGRFDVHHIPGSIRTEMLSRFFINPYYASVFQNKAMLPMLYPIIKQPHVVVLRMNGTFYDGDYQILTRQESIDRIYDFLQEDRTRRVIVKPNASSGGHNISILTCDSRKKRIDEVFRGLGISAFVAQEMLTQSAFTAQFNPSSVNTLRVTSLFFRNKVHLLASLIRIGKSGQSVDNWCSGGALLGVDIETGKCLPWAMANDKSKIFTISRNLDLRQSELFVPNFDLVKDKVLKLHARIPYIQLISWDIALNEENEPVLIECNFGGMIQIHEATTGPLFGDLTEDVLDTYLLNEFKLAFSDKDFIYFEYSDHVNIHKYIGPGGDVTVPGTVNGKPVSFIARDAFLGKSVTNISGPISLLRNSMAALSLVKKG